MANNHIMPGPLKAGKQFTGFSLEVIRAGLVLLPEQHDIVVNIQSGHYVILNWDVRYFVADGFFTQDELRFMLVLMERWPSYVPNDMILQVVTQQEPAQITQLLDTQHDQVLTLLHDLAEGCSHQMRPYGIEIQDIDGHGYKLCHFVAASEGEKGAQA